jgi:hypothetical protein
MMAKDFWQQVFTKHHVRAESLSTNVSASLHKSTRVLATLWQRLRATGVTLQLPIPAPLLVAALKVPARREP